MKSKMGKVSNAFEMEEEGRPFNAASEPRIESYEPEKYPSLGIDQEAGYTIKPSTRKSVLPPSISGRGGKIPSDYTVLKVMMVVCLIGFSSFGDACEMGTSIVGGFTDCIKLNATHENCQFKTSILTSLDYIGSKSCYSLYNSDKTLIASLEVGFQSQIDNIDLVKDYYTSDIALYSGSIYHCYGTTSCSAQKCETADDLGTRNPYGLFDTRTDLTYWPGVTSCRRSGGCAGNGCFYCTAGCVYSAYGIKPLNLLQTVYSIGQRTFIPTISIKLSSGAGVIKQTTLVAASNVTSLDGYTIKILGSLAGTVSEFGTLKVIDAGGYAWLGVASEPDAPIAGTVGQIQANALSQLNTNGFSVATGIVSKTQNTKSDTFHYIQAPPIQTPQFKKFPFTLNSVHWSSVAFSNSRLRGENMNPGALLVSIETPDVLTVTRERDVICPVITDVGDASGCFDCLLGSVFTILAKSSCVGGVVAAETDSDSVTLMDVSLILTTEETNYTIRFQPTKSSGSFQFCLRSETSVACKKVGYTAIEDTLVSDPRFQIPGVDESSGLSDSSGTTHWWDFFTKDIPNFFTKTIPNFFDDILKGIASWWEYLIFVILGVLVVVFLLFKIPFTRRKIDRFRQSRMSYKQL
jgi:hypothetical protein